MQTSTKLTGWWYVVDVLRTGGLSVDMKSFAYIWRQRSDSVAPKVTE